MADGGSVKRFRFKVKPEDPVELFMLLECQIHWANPSALVAAHLGHGRDCLGWLLGQQVGQGCDDGIARKPNKGALGV